MYIERKMNNTVSNLKNTTAISKKINTKDILNIHWLINQCNRTSDDVKKVQSNILINSYCKNKLMFSDRNMYFRIANIILKVGTITNDEEKVQMTFNDLNTFMALIFSTDISFEEQYEILNTIGFNYEMVCNKYLQSSKKLESMQIFYQDMRDCYNDSLELISNTNNIEEAKTLVKSNCYEQERKTS